MIPGLGRSPAGGYGSPLQYSYLKNPYGQRILAGYSPWGHKELDMTDINATLSICLILFFPLCVYESVLYIPCSLKIIDSTSQTKAFDIILDVHLFYNPFSPYNQYLARLQQYVNCELPDIQVGFRKGKRTRDQIANIRWIMEKGREFQKKKNKKHLFLLY